MPTIKDVAKHAQVSIATVSAALNKTAFVSPELLDRVMQAVDLLGYRADGIARSLKRGKTDLVGLIVDDLSNLFYVELLEKIEREAHRRGYSVLLCQSGGDIGKERAYLDVLQKYRVDGLIWSATGRPEDYAPNYVDKFPLPLVFVDRVSSAFTSFDSVVLDNAAAGRQATDYLLDLGHRRIAMLNGPDYLTVAHDRKLGFVQACRDRGIPVDDRLIVDVSFREQDAFEACRALFAAGCDATAVLAASGGLFVATMRTLNAFNLTCPTDVSVVGIDDFPLASLFTPKVTVVQQPVKEMGRIAFDLLIRRMQAPETPPVHRVVEPSLIVRNSCRPLVPTGEAASSEGRRTKTRSS